MVGEHNPAGPDADARDPAGDILDDHGRRGAGDAREVVVLGQPVAVVIPPLGVAGQVQGVAEGLGGRAALADRSEVEHGERYIGWVSHDRHSAGAGEAGSPPVQTGGGCRSAKPLRCQ